MLHRPTRNVATAQDYNSRKFGLKCNWRYEVRFFLTKQLHLIILCTFQDSVKWVSANRDWTLCSHYMHIWEPAPHPLSPYSLTISSWFISNHETLFPTSPICITLPVESASFFVPSTSFCSLSSWFTSCCAHHLITVTTFALTIYHSIGLLL